MRIIWETSDNWRKCRIITDHKVVYADFVRKLAIIKKQTTFGLNHWCIIKDQLMVSASDNPGEAKEYFNRLTNRSN